MAFVSSGSTYEVGNLQVVCHEGDDVDAVIEDAISRVENDFADYNQYRIASVQYRGGNYHRRIMVEEPTTKPFRETKLAEKLAGHLRGTIATNFFPVAFEIRLFVSYDEPML